MSRVRVLGTTVEQMGLVVLSGMLTSVALRLNTNKSRHEEEVLAYRRLLRAHEDALQELPGRLPAAADGAAGARLVERAALEEECDALVGDWRTALARADELVAELAAAQTSLADSAKGYLGAAFGSSKAPEGK